MGFDKRISEEALQLSDNNVDRATSLILDCAVQIPREINFDNHDDIQIATNNIFGFFNDS